MLRRVFACVCVPALLLALLLPAMTGCHVSSQKNGKNDNVDIGTPFGSMHVKTNDNVSVDDVGITVYPGALLEKKSDNGNDGAADVNMSFGSFHLGVKAVTYISPDAPNKILAFYKKDLGAKYGAVLQCQNDEAVGQPTRTAEGLTCEEDHKGTKWNVHGASGGQTELRTGSKQHQHIVAVEKHDGGTKIGLVALDLPGNLDLDDDGKRTN